MGVSPHLSRFVPVCPLLSRFGARNGDKSGQKRTNGDKKGHFGTNGETPPFSIYPHLALLKNFVHTKFPGKFPCENQKNKIHQRASAGAAHPKHLLRLFLASKVIFIF